MSEMPPEIEPTAADPRLTPLPISHGDDVKTAKEEV